MRRHIWLLGLAIYACSNTTPDSGVLSQPTRIRVDPVAFLGDTPCSTEGGMEVYQATVLDVTDGLGSAFALPSSELTPCTAAIEFSFVEPGRRYIAEVRGFDRSDLEVASRGNNLVRDDDGQLVTPRWETTCWGADGVTPEELGLGGSVGGAGGAGTEIGVESFDKTVVTVRGCEDLTDGGSNDSTRVSISIESALVDLTCGDDAGEVARFDIAGIDAPEEGGSAGAGGVPSGPLQPQSPDGKRCGDALIIDDVTPSTPFVVTVEGMEGATGEVIWATTCRADPTAGLTVSATCEPARAL